MVKGVPFDVRLPENVVTRAEAMRAFENLRAVFNGKIVSLYHNENLAQYDEVLHREKFHFKEKSIQMVLTAVKEFGVEVFPQPTGEIFVDMDDLIFYEAAMEKRSDDEYLVTGNQKHYPIKDFIVTPAVMMEIIEKNKK